MFQVIESKMFEQVFARVSLKHGNQNLNLQNVGHEIARANTTSDHYPFYLSPSLPQAEVAALRACARRRRALKVPTERARERAADNHFCVYFFF